MHLSLDLYVLVLRGLLPVEELVHRGHQHLLAICPPCREEHAVDPEAEASLPSRPPPRCGDELPPLPEDPRHLGAEHLEPRLAALDRIQHLRRMDRRHLRHLLQVDPDDWEAEVEGARSRYRNRSFAEYLLVESRRRVRNEPETARRLAALVPTVLRRIPGAGTAPWVEELGARSVAWQAEALRTSGDLPGAEALFGRLDLPALLRARTWAAGEITTLLASLRLDQGREEEAGRWLRHARQAFLHTGDRASAARVPVR